MTDTTDIAALNRPVRDRYDWSNAVWRDCDQCGKQHTGTVTAEDGSQICAQCADQLYWSAWQVLAERALDQLEAERQQREAAEKALSEKNERAAACVNAFEGIETDRIAGKTLGEFLAGEVRLNKAEPTPGGGFGFTFSGFAVQLMAESFADQFKESGAINYLELLFEHKEIGPLTVTMQRVEGLTPAHKLAAAEKSNAFLKEQLAQLANFNPDWDRLEACQESWREVVALLKEKETEISALKAKLANPVVLPAGYSARAGHPFHEGERNVMIPNKHGDWLSRFDVEHAIHIAGFPFTVKGE
ncbi:hypothetical protein [Rahnella sp. ChDrAdgB13]|uniref:hypothetical protein n=1 Tax=Rahnella sp. ChDrAdgB13 TaxID=1850581 RepID=UPI001AD89D6E|nr:hypothetical protein [Rahnella sp. ChDrAdgB13]